MMAQHNQAECVREAELRISAACALLEHRDDTSREGAGALLIEHAAVLLRSAAEWLEE